MPLCGKKLLLHLGLLSRDVRREVVLTLLKTLAALKAHKANDVGLAAEHLGHVDVGILDERLFEETSL